MSVGVALLFLLQLYCAQSREGPGTGDVAIMDRPYGLTVHPPVNGLAHESKERRERHFESPIDAVKVPPGLARDPPSGFKAQFWNSVPQYDSMSQALSWMHSHQPANSMGISTLSFESQKQQVWRGLDSSFRENFAAMFVGCLLVKKKGTYRFWTQSEHNDASRLWLDDKLLIDNNGELGKRTRSSETFVPEGMAHLRVAYWKRTGEGSGIKAGWEGLDAGLKDQEFSASNVYHPTHQNSCIDMDSLQTRAGGLPNVAAGGLAKKEAFKYPEEVAQQAYDEREKAKAMSYDDRMDQKRREEQERLLDEEQRRASRENSGKQLLKMRAEANTTHPELVTSQLMQANITDEEKVSATKKSLAQGMAEMEAILSNGSATPMKLQGFEGNLSAHIASVSGIPISKLDATADGVNAYNDGRAPHIPGHRDDPRNVVDLANLNQTSNMTQASISTGINVDDTPLDKMGFSDYSPPPDGYAPQANATNATVGVQWSKLQEI